MGSDDEEESTIFDTPAVQYIIIKILSTYPKVTKGAKFDKSFKTEENK